MKVLMTYAWARSVRHQTKRTNDLLNAIVAKFGDTVRRDEYVSMIDRKGQHVIYFKLHGNKYSDWFELWSNDIDVMKEIHEAFPNDFTSEVQVKEGQA